MKNGNSCVYAKTFFHSKGTLTERANEKTCVHLVLCEFSAKTCELQKETCKKVSWLEFLLFAECSWKLVGCDDVTVGRRNETM